MDNQEKPPATADDMVKMLDALIDEKGYRVSGKGRKRLQLLQRHDFDTLSEREQMEQMLITRAIERGLFDVDAGTRRWAERQCIRIQQIAELGPTACYRLLKLGGFDEAERDLIRAIAESEESRCQFVTCFLPICDVVEHWDGTLGGPAVTRDVEALRAAAVDHE